MDSQNLQYGEQIFDDVHNILQHKVGGYLMNCTQESEWDNNTDTAPAISQLSPLKTTQ